MFRINILIVFIIIQGFVSLTLPVYASETNQNHPKDDILLNQIPSQLETHLKYDILSTNQSDPSLATMCSYSQLNYTFVRYSSFSSVEPAKHSDSVVFTTTSSLPTGIELNTTSGILSGVPTVFGSFSIDISCSEGEDTASVTINLEITQLFCDASDGFQQTEVTQQATLECQDSVNQEGNRIRSCELVNNNQAQWSDIQECPWKAPWGLQYNYANVSIKKYARINNSISYSGRVTEFSISPDLPTGITLNTQTGLVSGQALDVLNSTVFTVTASNENNSATATFTLLIEYSTCSAMDGYPETNFGETRTKSCPQPNDYTGSLRRTCIDDGTTIRWGEEINTCQMVAPSNINYGTYNSILIYTHATIEIEPTYQHIVTSWQIDPPLPDGLTFSTTTGAIYGMVYTNMTTTYYQITASNDNASISTQIDLTIYKGYCDAEGEWELTVMGEDATLDCIEPDKYEGRRIRTCLEGTVASWGPISDNCMLRRPYNVQYAHTNLVFYVNYDKISYAPTYGGVVTRWTISPQFSNGLVFNETTGVISGSPSSTSSEVAYQIRALNDAGNAAQTVRIRVLARNDYDQRYTYHQNTAMFWYFLLLCYCIICLSVMFACIYCSYRKAKYPHIYNQEAEERKRKKEEKIKIKMLQKKEKEEAKKLKKQRQFAQSMRPMM